VAGWFFKASGIPDIRGRVGNYPGRLEAEESILGGYSIRPVTPPEGASGEKAVECTATSCTANFRYDGKTGRYDLTVRYFDVNSGVARYRARVEGVVVGEWVADDSVPTRRIDSSSSARQVIEDLALKPGDQIQIEGTPEGGETAALDYIEIRPAAN
jgi:alpha-glucuronidase